MALVIGSVPTGFLADGAEHALVIPLPPQHGGAVGWAEVYVSFAADFGNPRLRVAIWSDATKSWRVSTLDLQSAGTRVNIQILDGDSKVSVGRVKTGASDTGVCPIGWLLETTLKA